VDSQIEVIQSALIATKVIADLKLDQDPEFVPQRTAFLACCARSFGGHAENKMRYALSHFATNLRYVAAAQTYILEIEFRSPQVRNDRRRSANAVATAYVEQQAALRSSATECASNWLAERLTELRKQSSDAEAAVARYREQNGLVNSEKSGPSSSSNWPDITSNWSLRASGPRGQI